MAVRIRMKRMGRTHRPFFRICAMDSRSPRDGRVIEELGFYDPMVSDTDARVQLKKERVDHWISVGALPTPKVGVLLRKYGTDGTHLEQQAAAMQRMGTKAQYVPPERLEPEPEPEAPAAEAAAAEGSEAASEGAEAASPAAENTAENTAEETPAADAPAEGGEQAEASAEATEEKKEEGSE